MPPGGTASQPATRNTAGALDTSTFSAGIRLLPSNLQADARHLYRVLRTIDDLVDDEDPQAESRVQAIEHWANGEKTDTPETHILTDLSRRYPLPPEAMLEFCQGMRDDLERKPIDTEADLERYCQYVGGAVGVVLAKIFGTSHPDGERKMAILGRAFQRTNILRDIDEDHAHGRLYIARTTIEQFGPPQPGAREELLRDQIARADRMYEEGLEAIPLLSRGRKGMALSAALYREILRQIERDGYGRDPGRATIPAWRRHLLTAKHRVIRHRPPNTTIHNGRLNTADDPAAKRPSNKLDKSIDSVQAEDTI
jgi:phytoene synthase